MNEWEMVVALGILFALFAAIVKPIVSLTKSIAILTNIVDTLKNSVDGITQRNTQSHKNIWIKNIEQDGRLNNHETRIEKLEGRE